MAIVLFVFGAFANERRYLSIVQKVTGDLGHHSGHGTDKR
jgi:hypothetical protein